MKLIRNLSATHLLFIGMTSISLFVLDNKAIGDILGNIEIFSKADIVLKLILRSQSVNA